MADAKECDLCYKLYRPKEKEEDKLVLGMMRKQSESGVIYHTLDLCPSCQLVLEKWYNSRKEIFEK